MKFSLALVACASLALSVASLRAADDPDVSTYGFGKVKVYQQTSAAGPTLTATPYYFQAFVNYGTSSNVSNARVIGPVTPNPFLIGTDPNYIFGLSSRSSGYASKAALDSAFADSNGYSIRFSTPLQNYMVNNLDLNGAAFPSSAPQLLNISNWLAGSFQIDAFDPNAKIEFAPFTGMGGLDYITLDLFSPDGGNAVRIQTQDPLTNSFSLAPNAQNVSLLTVGATYEASLTFTKVNDIFINTSNPNDVGYAFANLTTTFSFVAIPEPSTYALMALGLGGIGWLRLRRSRR